MFIIAYVLLRHTESDYIKHNCCKTSVHNCCSWSLHPLTILQSVATVVCYWAVAPIPRTLFNMQTVTNNQNELIKMFLN